MHGVTADHNSAAIVKASIGLARNLGIEVIAEGVELQGFYFGRPVPPEEFQRRFALAQ